MKETILAYDLGTGGLKASVYSGNGELLCSDFVSYHTYYDGLLHEQSPSDWWDAVVKATHKIAETVSGDDICCIGVSGHSLGALPMDSKGELLAKRVPLWSDKRAEKEADRFFQTVSEEEWYLKTGNGFPAALYSLFKQMWYKANIPDLYERTSKFIGTKDYINYLLTGAMVTDHSYASGSGAYDLKQRKYDEAYISAADIDRKKYPEIVDSTQVIGKLTKDAAALLHLPEGIPVVSGGVDNACMALGAGCIGEGDAYTSLGSSAWVAVSGSVPIVDIKNKPYVFAHCVPGMYVSHEAIFSGGSSLRWLKENLCRELKDKDHPYDCMTESAARSPIGANGLIFNPTLAGASSMDKSPRMKGGLFGLQLSHTQSDVIRAVLEGVCMNLREAVDIMEQYSPFSHDMLIVGGGGKSAFWRKLFANIYNKNIIESQIGQDAGSFGAAAIAAVGVGIWNDFSRTTLANKGVQSIEPDPRINGEYEKLLKKFKRVSMLNAEISELLDT